MGKQLSWVLLLTTGLVLASCGDERSSRRRRASRDDDGRPTARQPAQRTAQREAEADRGPDQAQTTEREAQTDRPADPPADERLIVPAEAVGTWTYQDGGDVLKLKIGADGKWEMDFKWDLFLAASEGTTRGTYEAAGSRIRFSATGADAMDIVPEYATMPAAGKLRLKVVGESDLKTLARAAQGNGGGGRQTERREEREEDRLDPRALVGVWTTNAQVGQVTLALQADGNFIMEVTSPYAVVPARYYGSYTVAGNRLTLKYGGGMMPDDTSVVHMPNNNLLVAKGITGLSLEYRRVQQAPGGGR